MSQSFVNAVYYPSWMVYREKPPSSMQMSIITHVYYAFVGVKEDGTLRWFDEWADFNKEVDGVKGCLAALAKLKHQHPHIKTIVSVGGGTGSKEFPALAANPAARKVLAGQLREFCDKHNLDGVDIDWEHPQNAEQGVNYIELLRDIRQTLPAPTYLLTTALPIGEYCLRHIDLKAASSLLDFLNLMAYDMTGGWTEVSGHHAQLLPPVGDIQEVHPVLRRSCSQAVEYIVSHGFSNNKLILGIPTYARFFPRARGAGHPFHDAGEMDYCDIDESWVCSARVDESVAAASFLDPCGEKGFISFDVPATVQMKARYAKAMALGGLFYWTGTGDRTGEQSLVAVGYNELVDC
ncbi:glycoside hydrolase superfamily [Stachybotrys elegans]|uniref:chitinase n=1 Tax=Stachybotrys elegans TaxID=80388 RepID=A0A8K0WL22_9HYPO|nr:glycoside hydrolase superfamily [Stachybotrys elegans]